MGMHRIRRALSAAVIAVVSVPAAAEVPAGPTPQMTLRGGIAVPCFDFES